MGSPDKRGQHYTGFCKVCRLAVKSPTEPHDRIRSQNKILRTPFRYYPPFQPGIFQCQTIRGQGVVFNFLSTGKIDL